MTNCVAIDGDFVGNLLLVGPGAGAKPTASAVASDILDIARGLFAAAVRTYPRPSSRPYKRAKLGAHQGAYYVRLSVFDRPGAMAAIARRMGDQEVSLESIVQRRPRVGAARHRRPPEARRADARHSHHARDHGGGHPRRRSTPSSSDGKVSERPQMIRIETL